MRVMRHRLVDDDGSQVRFVESPNRGSALDPRYLIMHFTAGASAESSISWLCNKQAKASAHVVIARDGSVVQLVPFNRVAWHAGRSSWFDLDSMNHHSIGIELDNAGKLTYQGGGWRTWFGAEYDEAEVLEATHRHDMEPAGWHLFTQEQIMAAAEVGSALVEHYRLIDVIGHDDVSPGRKCDPGPAFPMSSFRSRVLGRSDDVGRLTQTKPAALNIRSGPDVEHPKLEGGPLARGTRVVVREHYHGWCRVEVLGDDDLATGDLEGWVASRFLEAV